MISRMERIERVLDGQVRPYLRQHGGNVTVLSLIGGTLEIKMLGQCAGCPAAALTNETLIEETLCRCIPEIRRVVLASSRREEFRPELRQTVRA